MARITGTWLSGASATSGGPAKANAFRGEDLGLPESGQGSLAGTGRRLGALMIDWLISMGLAMAFTRSDVPFGGMMPTVTLIVWFVMCLGFVALFSFTPGQLAVGTAVARVDVPERVGFIRALGRQLLTATVVPATITDHNGRGMQDRATGTAVVRVR